MMGKRSSFDVGYECDLDGSMIDMDDVQHSAPKDNEKHNGRTDMTTKDEGLLDFNVVKQFCKCTTAHGFRCASNCEKNRFLRVGWSLAILAALAFLGYVLVELWKDYHRYPVKTLIDLKYTSDLLFPSVTICIFQALMCRNADRLPNVTNGAQKLCNILSVGTSLSGHRPRDFVSDYLSDPEYQEILKSPAADIYKTTGATIDEIFKFCSWDNHKMACDSMFREVYYLDGKCFQFNYNSSNPVRTSLVGPSSGLTVTATLPGQLLDTSSGLKVLLHTPGALLNQLSQGFLISPGFSTFARLHVRQGFHLPYPFKSFGDKYCVVHEEQEGVPTYNRDSCMTSCAYDLAVKTCNCSVHFDENTLSNYSQCSLLQVLACVLPAFDRALLESVSVCPHCNYACHTTLYSLTTSQAIYPVHEVNELMPAKNHQISNQRRYLELRLFYDQLSTEVFTYQPEYTWHTVLGFIGGHMGFFIGASLLTVLEMCECLCFLVLESLTRIYRRLWPKKATQNGC